MSPSGNADRPIEVSTDERGVVTVTLRRAEKGNALTLAMVTQLRSAIDRLDAARLLVLRGEGRHFCTGMDVSAGPDSEAAAHAMFAALEVLARTTCPVVALVQGGAIGAGLCLAACADMVLATEDAFFSMPETRLGIVPDHLLPFAQLLLGSRVLHRYALSAERLLVRDAIRMGAVIEPFPTEAAREAALSSLIESILRAAPHAIRRTKSTLLGVPHQPSAASMATEAQEMQEGVASFIEKRDPSWYTPRR